MVEIKKPKQDKIEYKGKEYIVQKLSAKEAFLKREELDFGELLIHLIEQCTIQPSVDPEEFEHPNDIRDFGLLLFHYNYGDGEPMAEVKKKLEIE